jgi:hypothetical protein
LLSHDVNDLDQIGPVEIQRHQAAARHSG